MTVFEKIEQQKKHELIAIVFLPHPIAINLARLHELGVDVILLGKR